MQSVHAGACFVKVARFGQKSSPKRFREVISETFASFEGPFGSLGRTLGRPGVSLLPSRMYITFFQDFHGKRTPPGHPKPKSAERAAHLWGLGKTAFRSLERGFPMCF